MTKELLKKCLNYGIRMTGQRQITVGVIENSEDHPDFDELYRRVDSVVVWPRNCSQYGGVGAELCLCRLVFLGICGTVHFTAGGLRSQFGWDILILAGCVRIVILACGLG